MNFVIVTGMSGAGKSTVLKFLEDLNYYCVDNLPPSLIPKFVEICAMGNSEIENVAFGIDIRGGNLFQDLFKVIDKVKSNEFSFKILFLDCSDELLLTRYKESRRSQPLAKNDRIISGIDKERELLEDVKKKSTHIIFTSHILTRHLR